MNIDFNFIWKCAVIIIGGILILRVAGRKSISQLTVAQTVMMIAIGSLIIQPVGNRNIWITLIVALLLVFFLIIIEYLVLKNDKLEGFFYSKSVIVIDNGKIHEQNLRKIRLTVDMLEVRLRQQGIQHISDLQWATIESNGQLGYLLKPEKQYATKEDIQLIINFIQSGKINNIQSIDSDDIFQEIKNKSHQNEIPKHLK